MVVYPSVPRDARWVFDAAVFGACRAPWVLVVDASEHPQDEHLVKSWSQSTLSDAIALLKKADRAVALSFEPDDTACVKKIGNADKAVLCEASPTAMGSLLYDRTRLLQLVPNSAAQGLAWADAATRAQMGVLFKHSQ